MANAHPLVVIQKAIAVVGHQHGRQAQQAKQAAHGHPHGVGNFGHVGDAADQVDDQQGEHQQGRNHQARPRLHGPIGGRRHAVEQAQQPGQDRPEGRLDQARKGQGDATGHRQQLDGGTEGGGRRDAQGDHVQGGQHRPRPAQETGQIAGLQRQQAPGAGMEYQGRGEKAEGQRNGKQAVAGDDHRGSSRRQRRSTTSPGAASAPISAIVSAVQPISANSG